MITLEASLKLDCPRKELFEAVSMAASAASTRTSITILQNLKIDALGTALKVTGCDGEMWVERQVPCMVQEGGSVCLPARLLQDIVGKLPDGDVQITTLNGHGAMLQQGASEYRLQTLDAADFPEPPEVSVDAELTLTMGEFRKAIDSVLFAVSTDTHRQVLTGVLCRYDGENLVFVATDTHRLAVRKLARTGSGSDIQAIVPDKALKAIRSLPVSDDYTITLKFGGDRVSVEAGGARVVSQLLSGTYPNWERVVPTESTRTWSLEVDQLEEKVGRTMILAKDNASRVRFKGQDDQVLIAARSEEKGEAKEEVPMVAQNGDMEIAFNGRYVLDALGPIEGAGVRVEMTESSRPAIFKPADDDGSYFCVIMPMALA